MAIDPDKLKSVHMWTCPCIISISGTSLGPHRYTLEMIEIRKVGAKLVVAKPIPKSYTLPFQSVTDP